MNSLQQSRNLLVRGKLLTILSSVDYTSTKQTIFEQLLPAIRLVLTGILVKNKLLDKHLQDEMFSDATLHLWDIINRDKVNFGVAPRQMALFLLRDITYTLGRHFQQSKRFNCYQGLQELGKDGCCGRENLIIENYECSGDEQYVLEDAMIEYQDWSYRYSEMLGRKVSRRFDRILLRRIQYEAVMRYMR